MSEQLREFGSLDDVALHISKHIVPESLNNLRDVEKRHVHRVAFKSSHGVLNDEGVVAICGQEVGDGCNRVHWSPVHQVLQLERNVVWKSTAEHNLKCSRFIKHLLRKVQDQPPDFVCQLLRVVPRGQLYCKVGVLRPSRL